MASRRGFDMGIQGALAQPCDVRDADQAEAMVRRPRWSASADLTSWSQMPAWGPTATSSTSIRGIEEMVDVNVKGFLHTVRASLPRLLESDAADLVVIASVAGQRAPEGESVYAATKFAQVGFMRSLDHELYRRGVRCSTIAPGGVATAFAMGRGALPRIPICPA